MPAQCHNLNLLLMRQPNPRRNFIGRTVATLTNIFYVQRTNTYAR